MFLHSLHARVLMHTLVFMFDTDILASYMMRQYWVNELMWIRSKQWRVLRLWKRRWSCWSYIASWRHLFDYVDEVKVAERHLFGSWSCW